jgi:membrane protein involved in colicin uptake
MRTASSGGSAVGGPPLATTALRPDSSVAAQATVLVGSDGSSDAGDVVAATRATTEKEVTDATAAKKAADDATVVKKVVDEAAAKKRVTDDATTAKKATDDATAVKKVADEAVAVKKAADCGLRLIFSSIGWSQESGYA